MFEPRCPKCKSTRVQYGYTQPHPLLRLLGIKNLLCNNCNHPFKAFALHSAVEAAKHRKKKRAH